MDHSAAVSPPRLSASVRGFPAIAVILLALASGCQGGRNAVLTQLTEAGQLAADLRFKFNKASDASNRAVMADTDEMSVAFAREAEQDRDVVRADVAALAPVLRGLGFSEEVKSLDEFGAHFSDYEKLDRVVLELAVENTNLKAQRLSFGPAREAADAFRDALASVAESAPTKDRCRIDALVAKAVVAVRDIQVLQAPHIAESDDAAMARMETQMATLDAAARAGVDALAGAVDAKVKPQVTAAAAALDRFQGVSREIVKLSRRNSNVRSLALSLRQKPAVTAACDESLRTLQDAIAKKTFSATR